MYQYSAMHSSMATDLPIVANVICGGGKCIVSVNKMFYSMMNTH